MQHYMKHFYSSTKTITMNKLKFTLALFVCLAVTTINANSQVSKRSERARKEVKKANKDVHESNENLMDAKNELQKANNDSLQDYVAFKQSAEIDIAQNRKAIAELRAKEWSSTAKNRVTYNSRIAKLEEKNDKLQQDISTADHTNFAKWLSFKKEFTHDMKDIIKSLKDLGESY